MQFFQHRDVSLKNQKEILKKQKLKFSIRNDPKNIRIPFPFHF
jgi:hypothetical protein